MQVSGIFVLLCLILVISDVDGVGFDLVGGVCVDGIVEGLLFPVLSPELIEMISSIGFIC